MNCATCAALVVLVAASVSFGTSEARNWRCRSPEYPLSKNVPACLYATSVDNVDVKQFVQWVQGMIFSDEVDELLGLSGRDIRDLVEKIVDAIKPGEKVNWQKVNETITRILRLWCSNVDRLGGVSDIYEFDENVTPICHTMLYVLALKFGALEFDGKLLVRGPWNERNAHIDEQRHPDCYSMCRLFRDNGTVSFGGLRARPSYIGCYLKEAENGEEIKPQMEVNVIDCERWNLNPTQAPPTTKLPLPPTTATKTTSSHGDSGGSSGDNGGNSSSGSSPLPWILVAVVSFAIVSVVVGALAFYVFKIRPATSATSSSNSEPSFNLSKVQPI